MKEEGINIPEASQDDFDAALKDLTTTTEPDEPIEPGQSDTTSEPDKDGQSAPPVVAGVQEPTEPIFEIDGEKVPLSTIKQWKSGHMMQADYSRKTDKLKREHEQLELMRKTFEESLFDSQPAQQNFAKYPTVDTSEPEFATPTEERLYRELQQVKTVVGSITERQRLEQVKEINARIDGAIDGFKRAHPEANDETVNAIMRRANEIGVRDISPESFDFVYRGMTPPTQPNVEEIRRKAVEEFVAAQKGKKPAALESPAGVSPVSPPLDVKKLSEEEQFAAMVRELQMG